MGDVVEEYGGPERRQTFRLRFPECERPHFLWNGHKLAVTEISEHGLRLLTHELRPSQKVVSGTVVFPNGREVFVVGTVHRSNDRETVLFQLRGITQREIMAEQRRLLHEYLVSLEAE